MADETELKAVKISSLPAVGTVKDSALFVLEQDGEAQKLSGSQLLSYSKGDKGDTGSAGKDGVSPTVSFSAISGGNKMTVTDVNGTKSIDILNGADGRDGETGETGPAGQNGVDGFSPTVEVSQIEGGHNVTITSINGVKSFNVLDGKEGEAGQEGPTGQQGIQGPKGEQGDPFLIYKVYATVDDMNAGYATDGLLDGQLVGISTETGGENGGKLYIKGATSYEFFFDLANVDGIAGPQGPQGEQGPAGPQGEPGTPGKDGEPGENGVSPTVSSAPITGGTLVTITDATHSETINIMDGKQGEPGIPGEPGKDATINGENAVELIEGENVKITQEGGKITISSTGGGPVRRDGIVNAPIGCILAWSGTEDTIPQGWHICDGNDGTVDLRDKFVLGAGDGHTQGEKGGEEGVSLTVEQLPYHVHGIGVRRNSSSFGYSTIAAASDGDLFRFTTSNIDGNQDGNLLGLEHNNMPPYLTLYYIQKISETPTDYVTEERAKDIAKETGLPVGGKEGQILAKASNDNYDTKWISITSIPSSESGYWFSPAMTSDNTPYPYVASASSMYPGFYAWMAFDGTPSSDGYGSGGIWSSAEGTADNKYVQIDLGVKTCVSKFKINPGYTIYGIATPSRLYIEGSNDNDIWEEVSTYYSVSWAKLGEYNEFHLPEPVNYRYYRFGAKNVLESESFNGRVCFGDIQFYIGCGGEERTLPSGGEKGQVLAKASDDDYDTEWINSPSDGNVLTNTLSKQVTLLASAWDSESKEQAVSIEEIVEDETEQLIVPVPAESNKTEYFKNGVICDRQEEGKLVFRTETIPESDFRVNVFIFGENGQNEDAADYVWWSPHMTSDTTSSTYAASASSVVGDNPAWRAFDGNSSPPQNMWHSANEISWIKFDFGKNVELNGMRLLPESSSEATWRDCMPKIFTIEISSDDYGWENVYTEDGNQDYTPEIGKWMECYFKKPIKCRYVKLKETLSYNNIQYCCIGDIEFHVKEGEV